MENVLAESSARPKLERGGQRGWIVWKKSPTNPRSALTTADRRGVRARAFVSLLDSKERVDREEAGVLKSTRLFFSFPRLFDVSALIIVLFTNAFLNEKKKEMKKKNKKKEKEIKETSPSSSSS